MSVTFYLLVIAGSISLSVANPVSKPSFLSMLEDEAVKACIPDISVYIDKSLPEKFNISPSKYMCPVHCAATKLGIVNEVGLNKIHAQWLRDIQSDVIEVLQEDYKLTPEEIQIEKNNGDKKVDKTLNGTAMVIHRVKDACLINDETTRDNLIKQIFEDHTNFVLNRGSAPVPAFVPSNENSPLLEAVRDADILCMGKYNVSSTKFYVEMQLLRQMNFGKQHVCYAHCLLSELELIDENGLNKKLMDDASEVIQKVSDKTLANSINGVVRAINETVPLVASKCLHQYDETPQNYFASDDFMATILPIQRAVSELRS